MKIVKSSGAVVDGPIPLPTRKNYFTVLRSPHVNKKSREQFRLFFHKRLMIIHTSSNNTISELTKLDLPAGVDIDVKDLTILN